MLVAVCRFLNHGLTRIVRDFTDWDVVKFGGNGVSIRCGHLTAHPGPGFGRSGVPVDSYFKDNLGNHYGWILIS